ncbi:MAG: adenylosuccinate synthase [Planctomycetota bacterium]|nr:adenylosuccinate synthase [Planctomycetota bacterium]
MKSKNVTVVGLQWGDEGKGKVVDALGRICKYVVRFCGGANAGHTVVVNDDKFSMHLIPCGILYSHTINVIGNGVAFDPATALDEISALHARDVHIGADNFCISGAAHVVMPYHKLMDRLSERKLGGGKIGTTARGIGPCYSDKANRSTAIRVAELTNPQSLCEKVRRIVALKNAFFQATYEAEPLDADEIAAEYAEYGQQLAPMIRNTGPMLRQAIADGERILFEGGQGSMLDVDHGTYPFVTSSSVTACGVPTGAGVPPAAVGQVVGLIKAYTSRVGAGAFPTEQDNELGERLRERGREYGTTTGRPRRCGWFDAFAVRYAAELSGTSELALSLLDVLTGIDELKICTGYRVGGKSLDPFDPDVMGRAECVYETMPGWQDDISSCRNFQDLPAQARDYVSRLEQLIGRPIGFISIGPDRAQSILHNTSIESLVP